MSTRPRAPFVVVALAVPALAAVVAAVTLLVTSAPGGAGAAGAAGVSVPARGDRIVISNFEYEPPTLQIAVGNKVTVTNADGVTHTVTADGKAFDTGDLGGGADTTITIDAPGRYAYHCDIHNYMTGVIVAK